MNATVQENGTGQHNGQTQPPLKAQAELEARGQEPQSTADLERSTTGRFREVMATPTAGATAAGVIAAGIASVFGVTEALIGATAAYGVYLIAKKRQAPR